MSDLTPQVTLGDYSTDPTKPDYACPAYQAMLPFWQIVEDIRESTPVLREKKTDYVPQFEAESKKDYEARLKLTYAADSYALTLEEHVGLITNEPPKLSDDVPEPIRVLADDFTGEGDDLVTYTQDVVDAALHFGHAVLWTDYPSTAGFRNLAEKRRAMVRPYAVLYRAPSVLNWRTVTIGGVRYLTYLVLREKSDRDVEGFGSQTVTRFRHVSQEVIRDGEGNATGLGPILWRAWDKVKDSKGADQFEPAGEGAIVGPSTIPARIVYGGRRVAFMQSRPHLRGVALTAIEALGVQSDYANVMHKCNVPTPIFVGREQDSGPGKKTVKMGEGIDIPLGGNAFFLEPTGTAIEATTKRLDSLDRRMQRQGATTSDGSAQALTATEAQLVANSRAAKLRRAAGSTEKGLTAQLEDFAKFMAMDSDRPHAKGGTVTLSDDFAGAVLDAPYLTVLLQAWEKEAVPLDALLYALEKGRLPDDFSATETVLRLLAEHEANREPGDTGAPEPPAPPPPPPPPGAEEEEEEEAVA